ALRSLDTLWFNTGTLCNLTCANCYIESSPRNDRLVYLTAAEVAAYLDEIERDGHDTRLIGFTGGEPFMNRELPAMLDDALSRGFKAMVLTNAMKPMQKMKPALLHLLERHGHNLTLRVSIDHYGRALHEGERGARSWTPTINGLVWLARAGFDVHVAGRRFSDETEDQVRAGYARLFAELGVPIDATSPTALILFPEMDPTVDVPEITTACWGILRKAPDSVMCASARMVIKRKGAARPVVVACTLLPYDRQFELGETLAQGTGTAVRLNHPHCAKFCVLGGAACSA
ncbi:radical SAM protein, partial [Reyranella sp.]|uniref:radical SAM protein n=1 Tax=Reyranella sp. TaxID=1929291 RepID=UPI003D103228